ncbi:MAG TPA: zf-HC2 domain-containing protein, partial [Anaerolineales bacterium]|nr:zf-HC2 domain-containing protein [Anaerolineales bacterium]
MNGISHKQAVQWIHRRLDGLLLDNQALLLTEHLATCKTCRSYASEMDLLPVHLQSQFHARWDSKPGPTQNVVEHVMTKARRIPVTNRISSGVKLVTGASTLIMMAFLINFVISQLRDTSIAVDTDATSSPPLIENVPATRLLAFSSDQSGNAEIYTIYPDGSGM